MSVAIKNPYMWTVEDGRFVSDPVRIAMWNVIMECAPCLQTVGSLSHWVGVVRYLIMTRSERSELRFRAKEFQHQNVCDALTVLECIAKRRNPPKTPLMDDFARIVSENGWAHLLTQGETRPA